MGLVNRELGMGCSSLLPALPWEWKVGAGAEFSQQLLAWAVFVLQWEGHTSCPVQILMEVSSCDSTFTFSTVKHLFHYPGWRCVIRNPPWPRAGIPWLCLRSTQTYFCHDYQQHL